MTYATPDLPIIAGLRQRFDAGQALTHDDIGRLFHTIDALRHGNNTTTLTHVSSKEYTALVAVHDAMLQALKRAGLQLQRGAPTEACDLAWVWFYRWSKNPRQGAKSPWQGPFGTQDAAIEAAIVQIRSGALPIHR